LHPSSTQGTTRSCAVSATCPSAARRQSMQTAATRRRAMVTEKARGQATEPIQIPLPPIVAKRSRGSLEPVIGSDNGPPVIAYPDRRSEPSFHQCCIAYPRRHIDAVGLLTRPRLRIQREAMPFHPDPQLPHTSSRTTRSKPI
jgi:hypothetical protein